MLNPYDVLEIPTTATLRDVKHSYRTLALKYHPDKAGEAGAAKFKEINEAYEVLSDPQKRSIYDQYGAAGLTAMDSPIGLYGVKVACFIIVSYLMAFVVLTSLFVLFLCLYVDGHHLQSWSFVKVFIPLFMLDVFIGLPSLLGLMLSRQWMDALAVACIIALSVMIPVGKDRQNNSVKKGSGDVEWRVWLIPAYFITVFMFISSFKNRYPTATRTAQLEAEGQPLLAKHQRIYLVIGLLKALCLIVFVALVACRADETLTTNYFVIIGMPLYAWLGLNTVDAYVKTRYTVVRASYTDDGEPHSSPFFSACCMELIPNVLNIFMISMICSRMNSISRYGDDGGAVSLMHAMIPIFIVLAILAIPAIGLSVVLCCFGINIEHDYANDGDGHPEQRSSRTTTPPPPPPSSYGSAAKGGVEYGRASASPVPPRGTSTANQETTALHAPLLLQRNTATTGL